MMTSFYNLLKYAATGIVSPSMTQYDMMKARAMFGGGGFPVNTLNGVDSIDFKSDGSPLTAWSISGNKTVTAECGDKTTNLADLWGVDATFLTLHYITGNDMTISISGTKTNGDNVHSIATPGIILPAGKYTVKIKMISGTITDLSDGVFFGINRNTYGQRTSPGVQSVGEVGTRTFTLSEDTLITSLDITPGYGSVGSVFTDATFECGLYAGASAPADYEPCGYAIPISCGTTQTIYLTEPLRKALDGSDAVDVMKSDGTITREVDSNGDALVTPVTETYTAPTITPTKGANTLSIETTLQPSEVSITGHIKQA